MADLNKQLNISAGDSTEIRGITAPGLGDEYLDSYYDILTAAEKNTIHFAETQADLPTSNEYDELIGIAETVRNDSSQRTLHYYDGTEWFDTLDSKIIEQIEDEINAIEDDIGDWSPATGEKATIAATLGHVSGGESDLATRVRANEDDIGNVGNTDLQTQINNNNDDIGNVGNTDLQTQINNNNDDIGNVPSWEDDLQTQINDLEDDVGSVSSWEDDLQTQIDDLEDDVGGVNGVSDLQGGNVYVGRIKADDLDEDMHDGRNGTVTWDLEDEVWGFDSSSTLVSATVETQPWTSIEHYYGGCITTSTSSSGSVSAFFILNWESEVKVTISYLYY